MVTATKSRRSTRRIQPKKKPDGRRQPAELRPHPAALSVPRPTEAEYQALREDVRERGQLEPIWVDGEGRIVDGLTRYQICCELGIEPRTRPWSGDDAFSFVMAKNLHRRQLTASQRAWFAVVHLLPSAREKAQARQRSGEPCPNGEKASEEVARRAGCGTTLVENAARVQRERPDLFAKLETGEETVGGAMRIVRRGRSKDLKPDHSGTGGQGDSPEPEPQPEVPWWIDSLQVGVATIIDCCEAMAKSGDLPEYEAEARDLLTEVRAVSDSALEVLGAR